MTTIAICTWNRAAMLDRMLESLRALRIPPGHAWEVLVVNNNCTDATDAVLERHAPHLPLRRAFEPVLGIAHARNRALTEARGDLILWTDDDMAVPGDWLENYCRAVERYPKASLFGGPIHPWFAENVPPAVQQFMQSNERLLSSMFGVIDFGREVRPLARGEVFFSGNMALRTAAARRFRFDCRFGRVGREGLLGGEETLLLEQMLDAGEQGVWVGNAAAKHYIPAERLTRSYAWQYFMALGRTQVRRDGIAACPTLFGQPRWALLQYYRNRLTAWLARKTGGAWLPHYLAAAKLAGYLAECADHRHQRSPDFLVPPHRAAAADA